MRWLLFASRVALICNLFFITCLVLGYADLPLSQYVKGFIIIVGYPLSIISNLIVNGTVVTLSLRRKPVGVPFWLVMFNLICFVIQLVYLLLF